MKFTAFFVILLGTVVTVRAAESSDYKSESQAVSELFTSKVTKVYAARDGENTFVAYVVQWKEQEVVVIPRPFLREDFAVGDAVRCQMEQSHPLRGLGGTRPMTFMLFGRPGDTAIERLESEKARLAAVAAEVEKRRVLREAAAAQIGVGSQQPNPGGTAKPGSVTPRASESSSK